MYRYFKHVQDPISSYTHFLGALFSIFTCISFLVIGLFHHDSWITVLSCLLFACSAIALYSASCLYHTIPLNHPKHTWFRKLDHSMIYILIAGSYTPIALHYLKQSQGIIFITILWCIALLGIIIKLLWLNAPRFISTLFYLIMGWSVLFYFPAFYNAMEKGCLALIAIGGIFYTIGGIMYIIKKPNITSSFGFHELFHCFIMAGTLFHFLASAIYIL